MESVRLMLEMAYAGYDHGYTIVVAILYGVIVAYGAAGLYYRVYACLVCYLHTVGKGEERI